jgi:dTDP-4-amino-4,6-dideoxygalactose transaminase
MTMRLPFNRPYTTGVEIDYIREAIKNGHLSGNGPFSKRCTSWLEEYIGSQRALLTHSCTGALEIAAMLAEVGEGDEVVMPSFTFVSTANAFALRGATPVFVDIRGDTLNLDESLVEAAVTERTRAIVAVHYAGVGCAMDEINSIARRRGLLVVEDAAQGVMASYRGRPLGGLSALGAVSFHETKNVIAGEGGALLVNDPDLVERAEIIQEKGTNRSRFFRGEVDKYTWVDIGSSYVPSEINAAFLWAQLERAASITADRLAIWDRYHSAFADAEADGLLRRPFIPAESTHNAHMYYVLLASEAVRAAVIERLRQQGAQSVFHYVPLHSSEAGQRFGRAHGDLPVTEDVSNRLLRLPLWLGMSPADVDRVAHTVVESARLRASAA